MVVEFRGLFCNKSNWWSIWLKSSSIVIHHIKATFGSLMLAKRLVSWLLFLSLLNFFPGVCAPVVVALWLLQETCRLLYCVAVGKIRRLLKNHCSWSSMPIDIDRCLCLIFFDFILTCSLIWPDTATPFPDMSNPVVSCRCHFLLQILLLDIWLVFRDDDYLGSSAVAV